LTANANFTTNLPIISNIVTQLGAVVQVKANVSNANNVLLAWRADSADVFVSTPMFDDGLHQDGLANDGVFGASFPQEDARMQYYIYAENAQAGIFSPERAEHEFYVATPLIPNVGDVVINEFLADNVNNEVDEAGEQEDWLELYNNTMSPITLTGFYLSDDPENLNKWAFPAGVSIPGHGFLIVWLDDDALQGPYHANFKLLATGEQLILSDGVSTVLDGVTFGQQIPDVSFGRYPNGTGNFTFMPITFNANNQLTIGTSSPQASNNIQVYPNPATESLAVKSDAPLQQILVWNALGQQLYSFSAGDENEYILPVINWKPGVYWLGIGGQNIRIVVNH
jgi:hypothetical protein